MPLMKNVFKPLVKSVLISIGLTAATSAADVGIYKNILRSGTTTLVISDEDIKYIMKIGKFLVDSRLLLNGVTQTIENETKEKMGIS